MDDDLGDLDDIMGDDYDHGYDDAKGDPNIKPKPAEPPTEDASKRSSSTLRVVFPPPEQFCTKVVVQAMPLLKVKDPANKATPFKEFSTAGSVGGMEVTPQGDPTKVEFADFAGLYPGMPYVFRLKLTNPAGTVIGKTSKPMLTVPAAPAAPTFMHSKAGSIFIKFKENSRGGMQVVNKLTIGVAKAGPADPFAPKNKPGAMSDKSPNSATLKQARIQKLSPGTLYVFRLTVANAAGEAVGEVSAPMLVVPGPPSRLREDSTKRTSDSITLKFAKHGQHLTHLMLQVAKLEGAKATFDQLMKRADSKTMSIGDPQNATSYQVKGLDGNSKYVFRLAAKNDSGHTIGQVLGPILTVEHAPEMLDKSGWVSIVPPAEKKSLSRRLSSRSKPKLQKYWFVIDGRLLNWFTDTDLKEEVGFLHLSKLKRITYTPDKDGQARVFSLLLKTGAKMTLECKSSDPNLSTHEYTRSWMAAIQGALAGMQKSMAEFKKEQEASKKPGRRASIQAAADDELSDDEETQDDGTGWGADAGQEEFEEEFGEAGEDEFGTFEEEGGGFDDDFGGAAAGDDDDDFGGDDGFGDDDFGGDDGDFGGEDAFEMADGDELEDGEEAFGDDFGGDDFDEEFGGF